jgi:hypothetical protein
VRFLFLEDLVVCLEDVISVAPRWGQGSWDERKQESRRIYLGTDFCLRGKKTPRRSTVPFKEIKEQMRVDLEQKITS